MGGEIQGGWAATGTTSAPMGDDGDDGPMGVVIAYGISGLVRAVVLVCSWSLNEVVAGCTPLEVLDKAVLSDGW